MLKYNPVGRAKALLPEIKNIPPLKLASKQQKETVRINMLLGLQQPYDQLTKSGRLTKAMRRDLASLGIYPKSTNYHKGLITVASREYISVARVLSHINEKISKVELCADQNLAKDVHLLLDGIRICKTGEAIAARSISKNLENIRKEHCIQLAQLGTLMLPVQFIAKLKEPVLFSESTAITIGRWIELSISNELGS